MLKSIDLDQIVLGKNSKFIGILHISDPSAYYIV